MDCVSVCPVKNTLELKTKGFNRQVWSPLKLGMVIVGLFIGLVYAAEITGHWKSSVSEYEFRVRLQEIDSSKYSHPGGRVQTPSPFSPSPLSLKSKHKSISHASSMRNEDPNRAKLHQDPGGNCDNDTLQWVTSDVYRFW